jgi:hypothetical protein
MAKDTNTRSVVFGLVFLLCVFGFHNGAADTTRLKVQAIYTSQIGVKELTGRNDGVAVEQFLKITGLGKGHPWCAAFVAWVYNKANVNAIRSAFCPNWFIKAKLTKTPHMGDVVGIYFKALKRIAHIAFYDRSDGAFVITVEGNTNAQGSRDGNQVARRRRLKRQINCYANWID